MWWWGGGGGRQRDLSASLPRPALGLTGAAEEWGQLQGLTRRSLDPGYPTEAHACECVFKGRKVRVKRRGQNPGEQLSQRIKRKRKERGKEKSKLCSGVSWP